MNCPFLKHALNLLRYLALWGTFALDPNTEDRPQARFLDSQGINESDLPRLIEQFVKAGIVRNWGVGRRLFAIQPLIVREYVLSSWLFNGDGEKYRVNAEGKRIIDLLVHGKIPVVELTLRSISHVTRWRLDAATGYSFVKPIFDELLQIARDGTVIDQNHLLTLIEILGSSDPESALDSIKVIREHANPTVNLTDPLWGKVAFTHTAVISKLPWLLFQTAAFIQDSVVASRYLDEFRELLAMETAMQEDIESGKEPGKLLRRLLCESKNAALFAEPASKSIFQEIDLPESWPFVSVLLECLLNPERESVEWTAQWTLTLSRRAFLPDGPEWNLSAALRGRAFDLLRHQVNRTLRARMWKLLAESHHQFHRLLLNDRIRGGAAHAYRALLVSDLAECAVIIEKPPIELYMEEVVAARRMWSWYLEYEKSDDLIALARRCEATCSGMSKWRPQDFFRFDTEEELAPETERVAGLLRNATDTNPFAGFFAEAKAYLTAARAGGEDMADSIRIVALADALLDTFSSFNSTPTPQISLYVAGVLRQPEVSNELAWAFAVRICQKHLLRIKNTGDEDTIVSELKCILAQCHNKSRFLLDMYSNPHPLNTGALSCGEFDCLFAEEHQFTNRERFVLLGVFALAHWDVVEPRLSRCCESMSGHADLSNCAALFIRMLHLTALRYGLQELGPQIRWLFQAMIQNDLEGELLGMHEFKWLRERSDFHLQLSQFVELMRSRIQLDQKPKTNRTSRVLPYEFHVRDWCRYDLTQPTEVIAFEEFCGLALGSSYIALYWMPKFIAEMDPSGILVASFIERHLKENQPISGDALMRLAYIASAYADESDAWARIARPICAKTAALPRDEREHVFFGLARKETGVLSSAPGQVPDYYVQVRDLALSMRNAEPPDSPLRGYREWALRRAESDFQHEQQRAEEVENG